MVQIHQVLLWFCGVVVITPACHAGDHGFKSHKSHIVVNFGRCNYYSFVRFSLLRRNNFAGIAQLVERITCNDDVKSSSLFISFKRENLILD